MSEAIFLDYHSTTPVDPRVAQVVLDVMLTDFGNAQSLDHIFGDRAGKIVETARQNIGELVHTKSGKITFTSGATESINIVLHHLSEANPKLRVLISPTEHSAVLQACKRYASELRVAEVDSHGQIILSSFEEQLKIGVDLVCIMSANNEIGTISPVEEIARLCQLYKARYLCDATQSVGKVPMFYDDLGIDYLVASGHKLYAPKGIGILLSKAKDRVKQLFATSNQDGARAGTLNVPGIAGMGEACRLRNIEMTCDELEIGKKRDLLQNALKNAIGNLKVNGDIEHRLSGNLHVSIPGALNDAVISRIRSKVAISRGATCSAGVEEPSHVLKAIRLTDEEMEGAFRFGVGKFTTDEEIDEAVQIFIQAVSEVRQRLEVCIN